MTVDPETLRGVVREILVELLDAPGSGLLPGRRSTSPAPRPRVEVNDAIPVTLASDADLQSFVLQILRLAEDPVRREALRTGQIRFARMRDGERAKSSAEGAERAKPSAEGVLRIDRGALTERTVNEAARAGRSIVLAKGAVVTPLALEKARTLGVAVSKETT